MGNEGQSRRDHTLPHLRTMTQRSCQLPVQGQRGRRVGRACARSLGQQHVLTKCQSLYPEAFPSALSLGRRQCHTRAPRSDQQFPTVAIGALPPTELSFQSVCHSNAVTTINWSILILSCWQKLLLQCSKSLRSPNPDSSQDSAEVRRQTSSLRSHETRQ